MRLQFLTVIVSPVLFVGALAACGSSTSTSATTVPVRESIGLQAPTQSQGSAAATVAATSTVTGLPAPPPTTVAVTTTVPQTYIVQAGDQLKRIAKKFGVSVTELMKVNSIANADKIEAGQTLIIPPTTAVGATRAPLPATARTSVSPTATTAKKP